VNLLNPSLIVLGGLHGRIHAHVRTALEDELPRHSLPAPRALVRVVPASLGVDAPLVGASELAFEPLLADPLAWFPARTPALSRASA
jgi:predicted NBD/HSP70 family sugar kinase